MATIRLNGVETDANSITGSDLPDKLTVRGGVDGLNVDLADGDDRVEIYANSEDVKNTEIRVSEGDDVVDIIAADSFVNDIHDRAQEYDGGIISLGDSVLGGPGSDVIMLEDGLVQLSGAVKGNEDDDTIHVANINGGTVNGNAGDDVLRIGTFANEVAGSRAANAVTNGSVMGGQGDDNIAVNADVTDSAIRGNEGDDTITLNGSTFSGSVTVNGNAGADTIDASGADSAFTINGGADNDTIVAGNGQTVKGGKGTDTFVVGASGGVFIEDFDKLDLPDNDPGNDDDDCFCDERINVQNINFDTHNYDVERVKYTSASSWTGDIKVKAVAEVGDNDTAKAQLTATKTATVSAFAVARLFITKTDTANTEKAEAVKYDATDLGVAQGFGVTKNGATFVNGLAIAAQNQDVTVSNAAAIRGRGIGAAYAQATGYWNSVALSGGGRRLNGTINNIIAQTFNQFEKGDFSFLQLTATAKAGITTNAKLVYNQVTNATIKNHWASYNKVKDTNTANLFTMDFGTRNFNRTTIGKAYMVVTEGIEDKAYKTETITGAKSTAIAKVTLTLDNTFEAWHKVAKGGAGFTTTTTNLGGQNFWDKLSGITQGTVKEIFASGLVDGVQKTGYYPTGKAGQASAIADGFAKTMLNQDFFRLQTKNTRSAPLTRYQGRFLKADGELIFNTAQADVVAGKATVPVALGANDLYWSTVQRQNLATVTETVRNTALAGLNANGTTNTAKGAINPGHDELNDTNIFRIVGENNVNVTVDDFANETAELVMKIKVSDTDTAEVAEANGTIVRRTTIFGQDLGITSCPDFPAAGSVTGRIVDGQAKHGDVVGDFNNVYLWTTNRQNSIGTTGNGAPAIANATGLAGALNGGAGINQNNGFFSAAEFTVTALAAQGFGDNAVEIIRRTQGLTNVSAVNANSVPFRVLFFDNDAASNGLHVISGEANYAGGALTAVNIGGLEAGTLLPDATNATTSSFGGKHTIVKVTGGKGSVIELADINFI